MDNASERMSEPAQRPPRLIITADDWGYSPRYNAGILEAAGARAIDAVSAMVLRPDCEPEQLLGLEVGVGLHLEAPADPRTAIEAPQRQAERFGRLFGRPPDHLDGHRHCHVTLPLATAAEELALELGIPLRAVGEGHCLRLRERGIACPDRLIGRIDERDPAQPAAIADALEAGELAPGVTEWVVHPGQRDPGAGSSYDRGREEDFALLLRLSAEPLLRAARASHRDALGG